MAKKKLNPSIKRSRTRSGCVTCRDRHIKCDEQLPICKNCIKSNRKCYRGIRLNFTQYTFYDPDEHKPKNVENDDQQQQQQHQNDDQLQSHSRPGLSYKLPTHPRQFYDHYQQSQQILTESHAVKKRHRILDQSITIASLYDDTRNYRPYLHLHSQADLRESDLQFQEDTYNSYVSTSDRKSSSISRSIAPPSSSLSVIRPVFESHPARSSSHLQQSQSQSQSQPQLLQQLSTPLLAKDNSQFINQLSSQNTTPFNPDFFTNELYSASFSTAHLHQHYSMPQLLILPPPQPQPQPPPPPPNPQQQQQQQQQQHLHLIHPHSYSQPTPHHQSSVQLPYLSHHLSLSNQHQPITPVAPPHLLQLLPQNQLSGQSQHLQQPQQQIPPQNLLQQHQHQPQSQQQQQQPPPPPPPQSTHQFDYPPLPFNQPNMFHIRYDISQYIQLIENEKYYILLDLTNELDIWKSVVPNLCLRISEKDGFLLDCLMSCSKQQAGLNLGQLTQEQLNRWLQIKDTLVGIENIQLFEHLLISVVLILHGIYLTISRDRLTDYHRLVLNNQAKLFAKLLEKLNVFIENNRANNSFVLVNCIFTVTILKFYINKNYDLSLEFRNQSNSTRNVSRSDGNNSGTGSGGVATGTSSEGVGPGTPMTSIATAATTTTSTSISAISTTTSGGGGVVVSDGGISSSTGPNTNSGLNPTGQDSQDDLTYSTPYYNTDLFHIVNISELEIRYLNTCYQLFGYEQLRNESQLYKDLIWYLIKVDFLMNHPEGANNLIIDYNAIHQIDSNINAFIQSQSPQQHPHNPHPASENSDSTRGGQSYTNSINNPRYYARSFIREFIRKLLNMNNSKVIRDANQQLQNLFNQIEESYLDPEVKLQYRYYFTWTLRYVHPISA